jgi:hypothetical protein
MLGLVYDRYFVCLVTKVIKEIIKMQEKHIKKTHQQQSFVLWC